MYYTGISIWMDAFWDVKSFYWGEVFYFYLFDNPKTKIWSTAGLNKVFFGWISSPISLTGRDINNQYGCLYWTICIKQQDVMLCDISRVCVYIFSYMLALIRSIVHFVSWPNLLAWDWCWYNYSAGRFFFFNPLVAFKYQKNHLNYTYCMLNTCLHPNCHKFTSPAI